VRRRDFIKAIAASAAAWPLTARAQQSPSTIRRIGILLPESKSAAEARGLLEAFRQGLKEMGWVEGQNIAFEYRSADNKEDALPKIAVGLVQLRLDAILAEGTAAIQAAKDATQSIPIVMASSNDPVASRLIATLNQPGGERHWVEPSVIGVGWQAGSTSNRNRCEACTLGRFVESDQPQSRPGGTANAIGGAVVWCWVCCRGSIGAGQVRQCICHDHHSGR